MSTQAAPSTGGQSIAYLIAGGLLTHLPSVTNPWIMGGLFAMLGACLWYRFLVVKMEMEGKMVEVAFKEDGDFNDEPRDDEQQQRAAAQPGPGAT
jgi:hypothetical protein